MGPVGPKNQDFELNGLTNRCDVIKIKVGERDEGGKGRARRSAQYAQQIHQVFTNDSEWYLLVGGVSFGLTDGLSEAF